MKKRIVILGLAVLLLLSGCTVTDAAAMPLAAGIADQLDKMYMAADGANYGADTPPTDTGTQTEQEDQPEQESQADRTYEEGPDTNVGAIELRNAADLEQLRSNPDGNFVLAQDITVDRDFQPFGEFRGTLDGQNHWIRGFRLNVDSQQTDGLFYSFGADAVIKNMKVEIHAVVLETLPTFISGLVWTNSGQISHCEVQSEIAGGTAYTPLAYYNAGVIEYCTAVTKARDVERVYGAFSENDGSLRNCAVAINAEGCGAITGFGYRNWNGIEGCLVAVTAHNVRGIDCVASQNYADVRNCTFNLKLIPPEGEKVSWGETLRGNDPHFDDSNIVNIMK